MVNFISKYKIILLLSFAVLNAECSISQVKQKNPDIYYRDIASYLELDVIFNTTKDTFAFNDEFIFRVIYTNKTDTSFYFYPDALVSLNRELHGIFVHDINFTFLSRYSNVSNLVLIKPHENFSKLYHVVIEKPWCVLGKNELFVMYLCKAPQMKDKRQSGILYGRLKSSIFEIYIKE
jgi:hypothetical protein